MNLADSWIACLDDCRIIRRRGVPTIRSDSVPALHPVLSWERSVEDLARFGGGLTTPDAPSDALAAVLSGAHGATDILDMSCRHHHDGEREVSVLQAPSACRRWRRWPSELPCPGNDNRRRAVIWALRLGGGAALGMFVLFGLVSVLAS